MSEKKKILIVDDSAMIRRILKDELKAGNFEIAEAEDAEKAISIIESNFSPDLITMDVEMPGLSGFELNKKLSSKNYLQYFSNSKNEKPPVIFITTLDTIEDRKRGYELGATDFICKPFNKGQVLSIVNKLLYPDQYLKNRLALIVDDSLTARDVVKGILEQEGVNVIEAENGMQAFEIMCNHMTDIDILITDLNMPVMSGDLLVEKIRKELALKDLPIIFLTSETEQARLLELFDCGGSDYLIKPFAKEELLARILVHMERRELTQRLKDSVKELSDLSKMKDDLIAVCSHDLRSPLFGMTGVVEMLLEQDYIKEEDKEALQDVKASGDYLMGLVSSILDLSKIESDTESIPLSPVNVSHLVEACYKAMKSMAEKKMVDFQIIDGFENVIISGNWSSLMRAVNNLISNAIKFTTSEEEIVISIEAEENNSVSISVTDSGVGIENSIIPDLFNKYSRTSRPGTTGEKGTGLGMSIVKEIIDRHNGEVSVNSTVGEGSEFKITLPVLQGELDISTDEAASNQSSTGGSADESVSHVLLVEDNAVNIKYTTQILEKMGFKVTSAENGWAAIANVMDESYEIILMDIEMPELDGFATTGKIRELGYDKVPVIALSSHHRSAIQEKLENSGIDAYIMKPFKPKELAINIRNWIDIKRNS